MLRCSLSRCGIIPYVQSFQTVRQLPAIFGRVRLFPPSTGLGSLLCEHVGRTANASPTPVQNVRVDHRRANVFVAQTPEPCGCRSRRRDKPEACKTPVIPKALQARQLTWNLDSTIRLLATEGAPPEVQHPGEAGRGFPRGWGSAEHGRPFRRCGEPTAV